MHSKLSELDLRKIYIAFMENHEMCKLMVLRDESLPHCKQNERFHIVNVMVILLRTERKYRFNTGCYNLMMIHAYLDEWNRFRHLVGSTIRIGFKWHFP